MEGGVTVSFCNAYGDFLAAVVGFSPGNVLLRRQQYRVADDDAASCAIAREMVAGKLANSRQVLMRAVRDHGKTELEPVCRRLLLRVAEARKAVSLDALRGIEGEAADTYFSHLNTCLTTAAPEWQMQGRTRRPPLDRINCLLSFLYALLAHDCRSALESVGLDAAVGFLHRDRPGRPAWPWTSWRSSAPCWQTVWRFP